MKKVSFIFLSLAVLTASIFISCGIDECTNFTEVKIGHQTWMTKNLNVSIFRNGDPILHAKTNEEWEKAGENEEPAWCYYGNSQANGAQYGKLYNWYAVNDRRGLAPVGFHIPTDPEWTFLMKYFGRNLAATTMKSTSGWTENGNGTNESGFSGFPGGYRFDNGIFGFIGDSGYWWDYPQRDTSHLWVHVMDYRLSFVNREQWYDKGYGFSVRCLRD